MDNPGLVMFRWGVSDLPAVNASLNGLATLLLIGGYTAIKKKRVAVHRTCMIAAFVTSIVFLACYVVYHVQTEAVTTFGGPAGLKPWYLTMLASHIVLAAAVPVLATITLYRAWRGQFDRHRRVARIAFPIWLYVSVTGVLIYVVLYQLYPAH